MTRPLPASRDERIALAAHAILRCCGPDCQMDDGFERCFDNPVLVEFRVLVGGGTDAENIAGAIALNHRAADAIMFDAGFAYISYSPPKQVSGGYACAIRVPVGAP